MADGTYQPPVYRKQGGEELVIASSGTLTVESGGTISVQSGASVAIASGSSLALSGTIEVASGGILDIQAGAGLKLPFATVSSSATTIPAYGISHITGTTAGPTYLIANPVVGAPCWLILNPSSSGATHRAIINGGTTDITFRLIDGINKLTLATSGLRSIGMVGVTTANYQIISVHTSTMVLGLGTS